MNSDNKEEMFPIVDEQGNIVGAATRGECHQEIAVILLKRLLLS